MTGLGLLLFVTFGVHRILPISRVVQELPAVLKALVLPKLICKLLAGIRAGRQLFGEDPLLRNLTKSAAVEADLV